MDQGKYLADKVGLGIVMMLIANLCFAAVDTTTKWLLALSIPAIQLVFLRYAGHFVISLVEISIRGLNLRHIPKKYWIDAIVRAIFLVLATAGNFIALQYLPMTITSAIMFSAPIIVCFLSAPLLGEQVGKWRWTAIVIGFTGVLVVIRPFGEDFHWAAPLSVFSAFCIAFYSILTRRLAGDVTTHAMQFVTGSVGVCLLAPLAIYFWTPSTDPLVLSFWVLLGICGWGGHELMTRAHAFAPAGTLMPFSYSFLVYLIISSYLVFDHLPDRYTLMGAAIIVTSGLVIWKRERWRTGSKGVSENTLKGVS